MKTYLITGGTSGLGLETARILSRNENNIVYITSRQKEKADEIAKTIGKNVNGLELNMSSLKCIYEFSNSIDFLVDGLVNNAGVQFNHNKHISQDGYEETIAVNHLGSFLLTILLKDKIQNGKVIFIGSGTHNPNNPVAKLTGFKGARDYSFQLEEDVISIEDDYIQINKDRYATSKLYCMLMGIEFSKRYKMKSYVVDPGLMPGTGLASEQSSINRFIWYNLLPLLVPLLPDTSTAKKSANAIAFVLESDEKDIASGSIISYDKKPNRHVWKSILYNDEIRRNVFVKSINAINKIDDKFLKGEKI